MAVIGGQLKVEARPEQMERARTVARAFLAGISEEIAQRMHVPEDVRAAWRAYQPNIWSTPDEYRMKRGELLKRHHPDPGGESERFQAYLTHTRILDAYFEADPTGQP